MEITLLNPQVEEPAVAALCGAIACGFPSPAQDYVAEELDLNQLLLKNKTSTFFAWAKGLSMKNAGIDEGDLLIIDKSVTPQNNSITICIIDGEFTCKRICRSDDGRLFLMPGNADFKRIEVKEGHNFAVWGVVTSWVKFAGRK